MKIPVERAQFKVTESCTMRGVKGAGDGDG